MSNHHTLPDASFHQQRRSLLRKKTRAGWGIGISGAMCASGLYYMAAPAGVAAYGYKKSGDTLEDLEQMMAERGIKPRNRDKLASFLTGTAEKLAISVVLLGHGEALCLDGQFGLDLAHLNDEVMDYSGSGAANEIYNTPVDFVKESVCYQDGVHDPSGTMVVGVAAGATEYATNKIGDASSNLRYQFQTGESQQARLQRMSVRRP
ncbi:hypothetical protein EJ07DRAFT_151362 [Lizonia empirigonia]|nr:hypothetical protein EJ07DRAFT_151362 [Lizonia empirigonia]